MKQVICIGAGPAGLTAAYKLIGHPYKLYVLEADPTYVGGISRTVERDGFRFDIGGHRFFSKSSEVMDLWKEILGQDLLTRRRKSRIFYDRKFYPYPLNFWRTLSNLGIGESVLCGLSYLRARLFPYSNPRTLEKWVTNQFGARLFRTFFKTYTEKVWGIPCNTISADWAAQRIKGLSLLTALKNALISALGMRRDNKIKTLIEEFLYPRKGPGMMWEVATAKIVAAGQQVKLGCKVKKITYHAPSKIWKIEYLDQKTNSLSSQEASHVISSMPIRELIKALDMMVPDAVRHAASQLRYRDFIAVALVLKERNVFDDNWIYIHEPGVQVGRIQNFKSWSPEMVPDPELVCYGMEYFCFEGDNLWESSDEALIALASRELVAIGLAAPEDIQKGYVVRQPKAYPVYDESYQSHIDIIRTWLAKDCPNLQVVGRNGMHKYNNQDHSMMTAMLAVKNILAGDAHYDVWKVNQDAEYHEDGEAYSSGASGERHVPIAV